MSTTHAILSFRYQDLDDPYEQADAELWCNRCERRIWALAGNDLFGDVVRAGDAHVAKCPGKKLPTELDSWIYDAETLTGMTYAYGFIVKDGENDEWALFNMGGAPDFVKSTDIVSWTEGTW